MTGLALPTGDRHGWGIAGSNIIRTMQDMTECAVLKPRSFNFTFPVLNCLRGVDLEPGLEGCRGTKNVAYGFVEDVGCLPVYKSTANQWDHIVCGSNWMEQSFRRAGIRNVSSAPQGVDSNIFYPVDRQPRETFTVFSGGKFEYRKGQDIVIKVMAEFMREHADVRLVCAWANPWAASLKTMERSDLIKVACLNQDWEAVVRATLLINGVPLDRTEIIGSIPTTQMADVYRRCDVGLFPNRCEGGTNLVLMEAIACGLPCIATYGTGHGDLSQYIYRYINGPEVGEHRWIEPSLEMVITGLFEAYQRRCDTLDTIGRIYSKELRDRFTWKATCEEFLRVLA